MKAFMLLSVSLIFCVGCHQTIKLEEGRIPSIESFEVEDTLSNEAFKDFFEAYFSLSEEESILLNGHFSKIEAHYWENQKRYKNKILDLVGNYLGETTKNELNETYLEEQLQFPRKLLINHYVTQSGGEVEAVEIKTIRSKGSHFIYEVAVTTLHKVQPLNEFKAQYEWNEVINYYEERAEALAIEEAYDELIYGANLEEADQIRLQQSYWVEVEAGEALRVVGIEEANTKAFSHKERVAVSQIQHILPLAYYDEVSEEETQQLKNIFQKLMAKRPSFYTYFEEALRTSYEAFDNVWKDLDLPVKVSSETYQMAFNGYVNPYKDDIVTIELNEKKIKIKRSIYETKNQPRFIVTLPIKALLSNNQIVYYYYTYFVGMDQGQMEFLQFMTIENINEETYNQIL